MKAFYFVAACSSVASIASAQTAPPPPNAPPPIVTPPDAPIPAPPEPPKAPTADDDAAPGPRTDLVSAAPAVPDNEPYQVRVVAEGGFVATLSNFGEFGTNATRIDFREAAGQRNLGFYTRWSAELELGKRHTLVALYQPLSSEGTRTPSVDERYADQTFAAGQPVTTQFNFPFYRLSYLYDAIRTERSYFSLGVSGQIRNANYTYMRADGSAFSRSSDVGFVPALKVRGQYDIDDTSFVGFEADGIYAPISVLNGSSNDTVGAILDASLRVGLHATARTDVFFNLRYLGGGATNTDPNDYAKNWLHLMFVGLGATLDMMPGKTR